MKQFIKTFKTAAALLLFAGATRAQDTVNFSPPAIAPKIYAIGAKDNIVVDGRLDEESWRLAQPISNFSMISPGSAGLIITKLL